MPTAPVALHASVWSGAVRRSTRCGHCMSASTEAPTGGRASAAVTQGGKGGGRARTAPMDLNPPRGTRDFYPDEMALRNWLFGHWRRVAALHGFEEYDAPVLENEELYIRKAGEDVSQQLYNMEDRSGRRLSLRPEMTPSLARMVLAKRNAMPLPLKWFAVPQCWRYERTTRGRRREHYQWNMDVWGIDGLTAEAELLSASVSFMRSVGLTAAEVGIKVSTRSVLAELLSKLGVPDERFAATCVLVDKLDKMPAAEVRGALVESGLPAESADTLLKALAVTDFGVLREVMGHDSPAVRELESLFDLAEAYGYNEWLVLDLSVVRGLAYYTGVVFEGFDRSGELRAIFGGGRYDKLLSTFGGEDVPAAGFGYGDAVIVELLKARGLLPTLPSSSVEVVVFAMGAELQPQAIGVAAALRAAGRKVDLLLEQKKAKWVFKHADRLQAGHVVVVAAAEAAQGLVRVKRLSDGQQEDVPIAELSDWFRRD
eukprot:CAMPEP_0119362786 /NCGR_PEP_ID=MMETSP1334-20130426/9732_1 /TAXON_ID=127549 /ORGANISM="Calcidiscus leptoporus, Strain RCC1130" /LENGTH=484 /DNA_ID=CAMNT_0007378039 /DNA_START=73 /DNA_END=1527 /DNA_ORIENTATION=+